MTDRPVIYKITSPNNKVYIGQSWDVRSRFYDYKRLHCKAQRKLYNSFIKYGVENHKFEIIREFFENINQLVLDENEVYFIGFYKQLGIILLNLKGGGSKGKHSKELICYCR